MKKSIIYVICTFSLLLFQSEVFAQNATISGYVRDSATGEDLIGATVLAEGTGKGAVTNLYGFYSLTLPKGSYKIVINYIGYNQIKREVELDDNKNLTFEIAEIVNELEEVVVTSEAEDQNVSSIEMSTNKLDAKQIKQIPVVLGESDLIKVIQLLPGVSSASEGASGFNVRGGGADQNLVLLDEAVVYNSSHLFGFFSVFNSDVVKDVKLYKGGIPSRYGGRLSSVLDVRQKEGNNKRLNSEVGIGLISARALLEGPIVKDKGSFVMAGRRSYGDAFLVLTDVNSTAFFYDINMKLNYNLGKKDRIFLSGYFGRDKFAVDGIFSNTWGNGTATLRWNHVISDKLFANVTAINSVYDYSIDFFTGESGFNWTSQIVTRNIKADLNWFINDRNNLEFGLSQKFFNFSPGEIRPINDSNILPVDLDEKRANESSAYVSYEQKFGKLTLLYGLRFSYFQRLGAQSLLNYANDAPVVYNPNLQRYEEGDVIGATDYDRGDNIADFSNVEPRFSLSYQIDEKQSLKASYNRMVQYLSLISNTNSPTPLDVWAPSGRYLKPQKADQYVLGYFRNFADNTFEASIEVYYKDMFNLPEYVDGADLIINNSIETELLDGIGRAYGAEFLLRKRKGKFTGWISYTLARTERKITGLSNEDPGINNGDWYPANYDKTHDLSITASYQINKRLILSSNFVYATGIPANYPENRYTFSNLLVAHYEGRNQERLPAYHRLDMGVILKGKPKNGKPSRHDWNFGIYNLYNRLNASSILFRENLDTSQPQASKISLFGIVPSITYNLKLF